MSARTSSSSAKDASSLQVGAYRTVRTPSGTARRRRTASPRAPQGLEVTTAVGRRPRLLSRPEPLEGTVSASQRLRERPRVVGVAAVPALEEHGAVIDLPQQRRNLANARDTAESHRRQATA